MSEKFVVGLTGPTGCGKTQSAVFLTKIGFAVVDADEIVARLYEGCSELVEKIGSEFYGVVESNGVLNKKKLAEIVFSSEVSRNRLERIVWPCVLKRIDIELNWHRNQGKNVVVDAPLLFESGAFRLCDFSVAILSPKSSRLKRIIQRDGLTEQMAFARVNSQKSDDYYIDLADGVVFNSGAEIECFCDLAFLIEKLALKFEFGRFFKKH